MTDIPFGCTEPDRASYLARARTLIVPSPDGTIPPLSTLPEGELFVGVDLGTAYLVLVVLDENGLPIAGEYQFATVVRDGLVVDYIGAVDRLRGMKERVERRVGRTLTHAATGFPPGVPGVEVRATRNVVEAVGLDCEYAIDEPSAANQILNISNGVIVDVGGGTTGIAVVRNGKVIYTADEPTGGTHFSLVIAGAKDISFEEAEEIKRDPAQQPSLLPVVRPVMEKVASIVGKHVSDWDVRQLTLVGGTCSFPGMAEVVEDYLGIPTCVPADPLFITPLGIGLHDLQTRK